MLTHPFLLSHPPLTFLPHRLHSHSTAKMVVFCKMRPKDARSAAFHVKIIKFEKTINKLYMLFDLRTLMHCGNYITRSTNLFALFDTLKLVKSRESANSSQRGRKCFFCDVCANI